MTRRLDWQKDGALWPNAKFSQFVEAGGCHWHVQRAGSGPKVLLLHGTGASTHSWAGLFPALAAHHEIMAVDLPGHAFTRSSGGQRSSLPGMATAIAQLLERCAFLPEILIGHSAGAAIAIRVAAQMPRSPRCVIGINGALRPLAGLAGLAGPTIAKAITVSPLMVSAIARGGRDQERVARLIRSTGSEPSEPYLGIYARLFATPEHVRGTMGMMANWDVSRIESDLERAGCPLVLITGARDQAVSPADAAGLARRFGQVTHLPLPRLGHLAHEEDPETVANAILSLVYAGKGEGSRKRA